MVVARPDQYVAHVLPLDAYDELTTFFGGFMLEASPEQFVSRWTRAETQLRNTNEMVRLHAIGHQGRARFENGLAYRRGRGPIRDVRLTSIPAAGAPDAQPRGQRPDRSVAGVQDAAHARFGNREARAPAWQAVRESGRKEMHRSKFGTLL
jgi:hypothetical protein